MSIYVNGARITQTSLASLAKWDTWATKNETLPLTAGENSITYKEAISEVISFMWLFSSLWAYDSSPKKTLSQPQWASWGSLTTLVERKRFLSCNARINGLAVLLGLCLFHM